MAECERYLRTQQVAQALGVGVSTVKRWVDSGKIVAARTAGKHRLIPLSEALKVAQEHGVPESVIKDLVKRAGKDRGEAVRFNDDLHETLATLLRSGQLERAKVLIHSVFGSGCGAVSLADRLIRPAMHRIGHGWMVGALEVYQEHEASHLVATAVLELIEKVRKDRTPSNALALGATTEGDPYVLSSLLGELVLRELGWEVRNMGVNLPLRSLANATAEYRPRLVFLSINYLRDEQAFVREFRSFHEVASGVDAAVIVGGQALGPELRTRLVYAGFGDCMAHLAEFARRIHPSAVTHRPSSSPTRVDLAGDVTNPSVRFVRQLP